MEVRQVYALLVLVFLFGIISAEPKVDLTVVLQSQIFVDVGAADEDFISGYCYQDSTFNVGREADTGPGEVGDPITNPPDNYFINNPGFPTGSKIEYENIDSFKRIDLMLQGSQESTERIGAFFIEAETLDSESEKIIAIKTAKAAEATISFLHSSMTASIGDFIEIEVFTNLPYDQLRWRHSGQHVPKWDGLKFLTIDNIRNADRGIYECYQDGHHDNGLHAIMNLIIRSCPQFKYGEVCESNCASCFNGGMCDAATGECICRPGFMGQNCETGCGNSVFGAACSISCDAGGDCMGHRFCAPDPVGCSCIAGYAGGSCDSACSGNTFGANCEMECHCQNCDNQKGCLSGPCDNGYVGDHCQEPPTCSDSKFGSLCQYECHCAGGAECDRISGVCDNNQCAAGWGGSDCQQALPAFYNEPITAADNDAASITVTWPYWNEDIDYGTRPVIGYIFHYGKGVIEHSQPAFDNSETVTNLSRGPNYVFAVSVLGEHNTEGVLSPVAVARVQCSVPTLAPTITNLTLDTSTAFVSWTIPEIDDWVGCETGISSFTIYYNDRNSTVDPGLRSATITGLTPCTEYEFTITVDNTDHNGPRSFPEVGTTLNVEPEKIENLTISSSPNSLHLSWQEPSIASPCVINGYTLSYRMTELDQCERLNGKLTSFNTSSTEYSLLELEGHSTYEIFLKAYSGLTSGESVYQTAKTDENVPTGPPLDIVSDSSLEKQLKLTWDQPICGSRRGEITEYEYLFGLDIDDQPISGSTEPYNRIATFNGLQHHTNYEFQVRAWTAVGAGPYSDTAVVKTAESNPTTPPQNVLPNEEWITKGQIGFTWEPPAQEDRNGVITFYEYELDLYPLMFGEEFPDIGRTNETLVVLLELPHDTLFQFRVRAYTKAGPGPYSDFKFAKTPPESGEGKKSGLPRPAKITLSVFGSIGALLILVCLIFCGCKTCSASASKQETRTVTTTETSSTNLKLELSRKK